MDEKPGAGPDAASAARPGPAPVMGRTLTFTLAVAAGVSAANLYYNQPLLDLIGRSLLASAGQTSRIAMATQAGYAAGLLLFTPLGDILPKRRLIVSLCLLTAGALLGAAGAPSMPAMELASFLIGLFTVVPQVIIPLAVDLAPPERSGRVVGTVMSGLLTGILAARIASGTMGALFGWRAVFVAAAVVMVLLGGVLLRTLPHAPAQTGARYGALLRSLVTLLRTEPVLREASLIGGALFGAFSILWTVLVFRLVAAPYHAGSAAAGAFGLAGLAGVLAAPLAGSAADRRGPAFMIRWAITCVIGAYLILALWSSILPLLILGVVLLDFGVQAAQISNQSRIYALSATARSRVNSVYMAAYFVGGSLGSLLGGIAYDAGGFALACTVGIAFSLVALGAHGVGSRAIRLR